MREGLRRCILKMEVLIKVKTVERGGTNPEKISYEKTETEAHDGYDKWRFYYLEDIWLSELFIHNMYSCFLVLH